VHKIGERLDRERRTVTTMVRFYCRRRHGHSPEICEPCGRLLEYAMERLDRCPFGVNKPPCSLCKIHCYRDDMRTEIRQVMRFAGPRMLFRHPVLAIQHLADRFRRGPH